MRKVERSALVPYTARQMYDLVADVEAYPEFLPWCSDVVIHSDEGGVVDATMAFERGRLKKSFRTLARLSDGEAIELELLDGPFRHLAGSWQFSDLGDDGSRVALNMQFAFRSRMADFAIGPVFEEICNSLVGAFTRRAKEKYGR